MAVQRMLVAAFEATGKADADIAAKERQCADLAAKLARAPEHEEAAAQIEAYKSTVKDRKAAWANLELEVKMYKQQCESFTDDLKDLRRVSKSVDMEYAGAMMHRTFGGEGRSGRYGGGPLVQREQAVGQ